MAERTHPENYRRLQKLAVSLGKQVPDPLAEFGRLHQRSIMDGKLPKKVKELMALGISICARCEGCVAYHVHDALKAGAVREEILETISVALMMGGGPALIYGCEALEALDQFEAQAGATSAA